MGQDIEICDGAVDHIISIEREIEEIKDYIPKKKSKPVVKKANLTDIIGLIINNDIDSDDHDM